MKRALLLLLALSACRKAEPPPERISTLGAITALSVHAKGETTQLQKQDGRWRIVSPVQADADKASVDGIVSQLQTAHFKGVVAEKPTDEQLKTFELTPPRFVIRAKGLALYGGGENTFDGSVYVQREGNPKVYAASGAVRVALERSALELRDRNVFPLELAAVKKITLPSVEITQVDAKSWKMTRPTEAKADTAAVASFLSALRQERVLAFTEEALGVPELTGRFEPSLSIQVSGTRARVDRSGISFVAEVTPNVKALLQKTPKDFRDRALLSFVPSEVAQIRFQPGDFTVDRDGESWSIKGEKAKRFRMSSVMWLLESLRPLGVVDEHPKDLKRYGLGDGARIITLIDAKKRTLATLQLGGEVDGNVYARGSSGEVTEIDGLRLADLPRKVEDLLDP
ncbi:MAG: DUF4340 domain-containing protein [Myxococcaceae bacterium]